MKRQITNIFFSLMSLSLFMGTAAANHQQGHTETGTLQYIAVAVTVGIIGLYVWWNYY